MLSWNITLCRVTIIRKIDVILKWQIHRGMIMSDEMCLTCQNSEVTDLTSLFLLEKLSWAVSKSSFLEVCTCFIIHLWEFEQFQKRSQLVLYITRDKCEKLFPHGSEMCNSYFCFRHSFKKLE